MKPYRATIDVCYVGIDDMTEDDWWDRAIEALEDLGATFVQGGTGEAMAAADVIPDSPLDLALREQRSADA